MKTFSCFLVILTLAIYAPAQNSPNFSQYMGIERKFNPASINLSNTIDFSLIARQQWVGFENAPSTQIFNASTYIHDIFGGVGLNIINDQLGYEHNLSVRGNYSFPVQVGVLSHLVFGVGFGFVSRTIDGTQLIYDDPNDPTAILHAETFLKPDFSFGIELIDPNFRVGGSIQHLYRSLNNAGIEFTPRHYNFYGSYRFHNVWPNLTLEPYVLVRTNMHVMQVDVSLLAHYNERIWGGISLRFGDALSAIIGYAITENIRIGYSYDHSIGVNRRYSGGSHEIMISTSLPGFNRTRIRPNTPRLFN